MTTTKKIELLAPAKNLEYGREAINHGADAVYIGAPAFGARSAATNTISDIESLVNYSHLFGSKVFATVNTILFDNELEDAVQMIRQLYNIGVDALIIQDVGLLECDLPPIELHASTQCHNATIERVKFMESVGFARAILARETSLEQMREIRQATTLDLEAFVHGALCVSYSGQCYMSQFLNGRSGNRGCCSQPCRSMYDLYTEDNRMIIKNKHLLSLKDFSAADHLREMMEAGITSLKIEGRLKDITYVKNITAYYRQLLDNMLSGSSKASSGHCTFHFVPDPERTFNRGYTDYFLTGRHPMASLSTQKSIGKTVAKVSRVEHNALVINSKEPLMAGDGLCFFDAKGCLQGFFVNAVQGSRIIPNRMPNITSGALLWRNHDQKFEKQLHGESVVRKIDIKLHFFQTASGFGLTIEDEDGISTETSIDFLCEPSQDPQRNTASIEKQLGKMGNTPFECQQIVDDTHGEFYLSAAVLNGLRREAISSHINHRIRGFRPADYFRHEQETAECGQGADYRLNITNKKAEKFYRRHGIRDIEYGIELTGDYSNKALMTTKYCIRYELGCCLKGKNKGAPKADISPTDRLVLLNNSRKFQLEFDCSRCQMLVLNSDEGSHSRTSK